MVPQIIAKTDPSIEDEEAVRRGLIAANTEAWGRPGGYHPFVFHLTDPSTSEIVGGATGHGSFDWVFVEMLHMPRNLRGQGYGAALMRKVEDFARENGFAGVWLDTFSFQARPFYEKLGYTIFGTLEDHPIGGKRFFLQKRFAPSSN